MPAETLSLAARAPASSNAASIKRTLARATQWVRNRYSLSVSSDAKSGSASAKLKSMVRSLLVRDLTVAVTHLDPGERELFHGWKIAFLRNSAPLTDARRDPDDRPRRDFVAARRCGRYMLSARAWSVDPNNTEQVRQLGEAMRQIFADSCKQAPGA